MGSVFDQPWDGEFGLPDEEQPKFCVYAQKFNTWAEELVVAATRAATVVGINQTKVRLLDRYWEWYAVVPKKHRTYLGGTRNSHVCVFQVFQIAYERLRVVELSLTPPLLFVSPAS